MPIELVEDCYSLMFGDTLVGYHSSPSEAKEAGFLLNVARRAIYSGTQEADLVVELQSSNGAFTATWCEETDDWRWFGVGLPDIGTDEQVWKEE